MPITRKFKFGGGRRDGRADLDSLDTAFQHLDASGCTELSTSVLGNNNNDDLVTSTGCGEGVEINKQRCWGVEVVTGRSLLIRLLAACLCEYIRHKSAHWKLFILHVKSDFIHYPPTDLYRNRISFKSQRVTRSLLLLATNRFRHVRVYVHRVTSQLQLHSTRRWTVS